MDRMAKIQFTLPANLALDKAPSLQLSPAIVGQTLNGPQSAAIQQSQIKNNEKKKILQSLNRQYRSRIIALQSSIREVVLSEEDREKLARSEPYLKTKQGLHKEITFQLGDRVKINPSLKHRQFKQIVKQAGWNNHMKYEYDQVGTIIGLQAPGAQIATVFYQRSGKGWSINVQALVKADESAGDASNAESVEKLKVGDWVGVGEQLPEYTLKIVQSTYSLPENGIIVHRNYLQKILAFDLGGAAIVSINEFESLLVHPSLLRKANKKNFHPRLKPADSKTFKIEFDIERVIFDPQWHFSHTQILGKTGKLLFESNQRFAVEVNGTAYMIPKSYEVYPAISNKKWQRYKDCKTWDTEIYPFQVGDIVRFQLSSSKRLMKELGISLMLLKITEEECVIFKGYHFPGVAVIEVMWPSAVLNILKEVYFLIPVYLLRKATDKCKKTFLKMQEERDNIKVGDKVSLFGAKHSKFVKSALGIIDNESIDKIKAMTSNAILEAFDDDLDEAILRFDDGKRFACPSTFVTTAFEQTRVFVNEFPRDIKDQPFDSLKNNVQFVLEHFHAWNTDGETPKILYTHKSPLVSMDTITYDITFGDELNSVMEMLIRCFNNVQGLHGFQCKPEGEDGLMFTQDDAQILLIVKTIDKTTNEGAEIPHCSSTAPSVLQKRGGRERTSSSKSAESASDLQIFNEINEESKDIFGENHSNNQTAMSMAHNVDESSEYGDEDGVKDDDGDVAEDEDKDVTLPLKVECTPDNKPHQDGSERADSPAIRETQAESENQLRDEHNQQVFEDNVGCLGWSAKLTYNPRTKEIAMKGTLDGEISSSRAGNSRFNRQISANNQAASETIGGLNSNLNISNSIINNINVTNGSVDTLDPFQHDQQ